MRCPRCGLSYPVEFSSCPQCGTATSPRGGPQPEFLLLHGLGNVLSAGLAVVVAAIVARLVIQLLHLGSVHWQRNFIDFHLDKATDITIFFLGIVFVVWFRRARINAEHRGWRQRRARSWTFRGWIVPVVSLWIPFQLMGDIWRAGLPDGQRRKAAWLPALWWASFPLSGVHQGYSRDRYYPWPHLSDDTLTVSLCLLAVSGMGLIAIIRIVSYGPVGSPHPGLVAALPASLPQ
jgi:hypothetical protein